MPTRAFVKVRSKKNEAVEHSGCPSAAQLLSLLCNELIVPFHFSMAVAFIGVTLGVLLVVTSSDGCQLRRLPVPYCNTVWPSEPSVARHRTRARPTRSRPRPDPSPRDHDSFLPSSDALKLGRLAKITGAALQNVPWKVMLLQVPQSTRRHGWAGRHASTHRGTE